jgi:hypothetical protein
VVNTAGDWIEGIIAKHTVKKEGQFLYTDGKPVNKTVDDFVEQTYRITKKMDHLIEMGKYNNSEKNRIKQQMARELNVLFPKIPWLQQYVDFVYRTLDKGDVKFQQKKFMTDLKKMISANLDTIHARLVKQYTRPSTQDGPPLSLDDAIARLNRGRNTRKVQIINALRWTKGDDAKVGDLLASMDSVSISLMEKAAVDLAAEQYLRSDSRLNRFINETIKKHPIAGLFLAPIAPFPRVALNITRLAYKYSPANVISTLNQALKNKNMFSEGYTGDIDLFAQANLNKEIGRTGVGFVLYSVGALMAALGMIDIDDDDIDGMVLTAGAFKLRLSDLAPGLTGLVVGAAVIKGSENGFFDEAGVREGLNAVYDATLLGNIDYMFKYNRGVSDIGGSLAANYMGQYVPAALRLINKFGAKKQLSNDFFGKIITNALSGIPVASALLPNRVDPYTGNKQQKIENIWDVVFSLSPVKVRHDRFDGARGIAEENDAKTQGLQGSFKINGDDIRLNNREREKYASLRGTIVNDKIKEFSNDKKIYDVIINNTRTSKRYSQMSAEERKLVLSRIYESATELTKIKYWIDLNNVYVFTTYDKMNEHKNYFGTNKNVRVIPGFSGSKFIKIE